MRTFAACALAALLLGCSPSTRTGYQSPTGPAYTLSVVSGSGQSGTAVIQPVTFNVGGPSVQPVTSQTVIAPLPGLLVVQVRDQFGNLADGVLVTFSDPQHDVIDLGQDATDLAWTGVTGRSFPAIRGEAAVPAQPYRIGTWTVSAQVDPSSGTSNVVQFTVTGY